MFWLPPYQSQRVTASSTVWTSPPSGYLDPSHPSPTLTTAPHWMIEELCTLQHVCMIPTLNWEWHKQCWTSVGCCHHGPCRWPLVSLLAHVVMWMGTLLLHRALDVGSLQRIHGCLLTHKTQCLLSWGGGTVTKYRLSTIGSEYWGSKR